MHKVYDILENITYIRNTCGSCCNIRTVQKRLATEEFDYEGIKA